MLDEQENSQVDEAETDETDSDSTSDPTAPSPEPSHGVAPARTILEPAEPVDDGGDGAELNNAENDEIKEPASDVEPDA